MFERLTSKEGEEKVKPNFVTLGKKIVKLCDGVPLVTKTFGRILHYKTKESLVVHIKIRDVGSRWKQYIGDKIKL